MEIESMGKVKAAPEPSGNSVHTPAPKPKVSGIIVTKADKAVWAECCNRLMYQPRDKRLRYFHIGGHGITVVMKDGQEYGAPWLYGTVSAVL